MWLLNRKDENSNSNNDTAKVNFTDLGSGNHNSSSSKVRGLSKWRKKLASPRNGLHTTETYAGIEVSLSHDESSSTSQSNSHHNRGGGRGGGGVDEDVRTMSSTPTDNNSFSTVLSLKDQMDDLKRCSVVQYCIPRPEVPTAIPTSPTHTPALSFQNSTRHRLPLFRSTSSSNNNNDSISKNNSNDEKAAAAIASTDPRKLGHDAVMQLLRKSIPMNELALFKQEISFLDDELACMNADRDELEKCMIPPPSPTSISELELHRTLNSNGTLSSQKLAPHRRTQLQNERGVHLTVRLSNAKTLDSLLSKCAYKPPPLSPSRSSSNNSNNTTFANGGSSPKRLSTAAATATTTTTLSIGPHNCRDGGAATTIQHLALLQLPQHHDKDGTGIFMSRDNGKTYHSSPLPDRLQRRLKNAGLDASKDLNYLAVGPNAGQYYFVEFRSGAAWWGSTSDDHEFDKYCSLWDVHRVIFGPSSSLDTGMSHHCKMVPSWIIIARDGKMAWKNIPSRLQSQLVGRTGDLAPTEISLGPNGSYFVRYLDGTCNTYTHPDS
jgi:hypothetical protein